MKNWILFITAAIMWPSFVQSADLEKIFEKDFIEFALYERFPPYSYKDDDGRVKGIDVDIARAIGEKLGVQTGFKLYLADESAEDDLRNMVWKGHYLAGAPADVMLHAPYDTNFAEDNDKVIFTQPYYREVVAFAVNTSRIRSAKSLEVFAKEPIGVETASLSDAYLTGAYNGRLRDKVKHFMTVSGAIDAMVQHDVAAVMANRGELEFSLNRHKHDFVVTKLPTPGLSVEGWELSAAVSAKHAGLAEKVDQIIGELKASGKIEEIFRAHGISYHPATSSTGILVAKESD